MTKEEAERRAQQEKGQGEVNAHNYLHHHHIPEKPKHDNIEVPPHGPRDEEKVEQTLAAAEKSADKQTGHKGRRKSEEEKPDRTLHTHTTDARLATTLPIVQEAGENGSHHSSRRGNDTPDESPGNSMERGEAESNSDEGQNSKTVEYTVTDDDHLSHLCGKSDEQVDGEEHMQAPLGEQSVDHDSKRQSKPPRIASGIIPTTTPMYGEEEIGIAR